MTELDLKNNVEKQHTNIVIDKYDKYIKSLQLGYIKDDCKQSYLIILTESYHNNIIFNTEQNININNMINKYING